MTKKPTPDLERIMVDIKTLPTVRLWPHAGKALGLTRKMTYEAGKTGDIAVIRIGRLVRAPTAPLRKQLGL